MKEEPYLRLHEPDQWTKEFEERVNSHNYIAASTLADEAISRESIYHEREESQL